MIRRPPTPPLFPDTSLFRSRPPGPSTPRRRGASSAGREGGPPAPPPPAPRGGWPGTAPPTSGAPRSEEHTSELQSRQYLVCRLLLEKKKRQLMESHANTTIK